MKEKSVDISDNRISADRGSNLPKEETTMDTGQWPFCLCIIDSLAEFPSPASDVKHLQGGSHEGSI